MTKIIDLKVYSATTERVAHSLFAHAKVEKQITKIRLQEIWLEELEFHSGDNIQVQYQDGSTTYSDNL